MISDRDRLGKKPSYSARRVARGGLGLPKVLSGPAMPNLSMPCGPVTPETAVFYVLGHPMLYVQS
jgi:hypothetical protein